MVSKTILACLAVVASISMIGANVVKPNFGHCVSGVSYINVKYNLGFVIKDILGGVIQLAADIVTNLLGFVKGLLGGGSHGSVPYVACPSDIKSLVGVFINVGPVFGKICGPAYGTDFDINIFADVHRALSVGLLAKLNIDIGGLAYLRNALSLDICAQKALKISAILKLQKFKAGKWAQVSILINDYLSVVHNKQITTEVYVAATIKYLRIQVALLTMSGYPNTDVYISTLVQTCNDVFVKIGYSGSIITTKDVAVNVPSNCNCITSY